MNRTAHNGFTASSTRGSRTIQGTPRAPITTNHTSMTGPNIAPIRAVPRFCTTKSPTRMTSAIGTTNGRNTGVATSRPSIAPSTVMAGVIMPSAQSRAAPTNPSRIRASRPRLARPSLLFGITSARSARMPPSPWLSARITNVRYLTTTTRVSAQNTRDRMPRVFARLDSMP